MRFKPLGKSGLIVSELCLGTMIFGEDSQRSTPADEAEKIIHHYLDIGGNHIDTANVYAAGRSEEIVGKAIQNRRDQVVLATKVRFSMGDGPNDEGLSRYHILNGVNDSLRRLNTDYIDLLYMHCWDPLTPIEESLNTFNDLVTQGKVRYIGVSNFKAWQLMKALALSDNNGWARFIAAQYQYSLVVRDIEDEFIDLCLSEGVGIAPWGPLGGGFLSGKYRADQRPDEPGEGRLATTPDHDEEAWIRRATVKNWQLLEVIQQINTELPAATYSQIALAWVLAQPAVDSIVLGVRTLEQLQDNLGAADLHLTEAQIDKLSKASAIEKGYPYRFLELYGSRN
jgi:aryl-alcohol dehydrogenase-like predicted oxidoreductase